MGGRNSVPEEAEEKQQQQVEATKKPGSQTKDAKVLAVIFAPGDVGLVADWTTGEVFSIDEGCQAQQHGVKAGMFIKAVDDEPYSEALLDERIAGDRDYHISFSVPSGPPRARPAGAGTAAPRPKTFAEMAAEAAAKKKKAPVAVQNSAAADLAKLNAAKREKAAQNKAAQNNAAAELGKLMAAKKAAAQAKKAAVRAPQPEAGSANGGQEQSCEQSAVDDLPRGGEGAVWLALEDSIVRESRDVKSAKQGVIQKDEQCTQIGPWRAEPNGRVRMPVKGRRGCEGWVTLDARRCQLGDGSWGTQGFTLVAEAPEEEEEPLQGAVEDIKNARAADEFEDLLDMFGGDSDSDSEEMIPGYSTATATVCDEDNTGETAQSIDEDTCNTSLDTPAASELTVAQKRLRNARKKLREIETLEAKKESLTEAQLQRLSGKEELRNEYKEAEAEVRAEMGETGSRKRAKKPRKTAAAKKVAKTKASGESDKSRRLWFIIFALLPASVILVSRMLHLF